MTNTGKGFWTQLTLNTWKINADGTTADTYSDGYTEQEGYVATAGSLTILDARPAGFAWELPTGLGVIAGCEAAASAITDAIGSPDADDEEFYLSTYRYMRGVADDPDSIVYRETPTVQRSATWAVELGDAWTDTELTLIAAMAHRIIDPLAELSDAAVELVDNGASLDIAAEFDEYVAEGMDATAAEFLAVMGAGTPVAVAA